MEDTNKRWPEDHSDGGYFESGKSSPWLSCCCLMQAADVMFNLYLQPVCAVSRKGRLRQFEHT